MSNIRVVSERLCNQRVELSIDGQWHHEIISENGATLAEMLNAFFNDKGMDERVVVEASDGTLTLDSNVFILREGVAGARTKNGKEKVLPGDKVVVDRPHTNGS